MDGRKGFQCTSFGYVFSRNQRKKKIRFQNYSDARVRGFKLKLTVNGKPQPREQVFPLIIVYYLLYLHKNRKFHVSFIHRKKFAQVLPVISQFHKVIVKLNVTITVCLEHFSKSLYRENRHSHLHRVQRSFV